MQRHHRAEGAGRDAQGTNLRLDAALDNMSQGLCLYDADDRLQVVNRRFCEIFGLQREKVRPGLTFRGRARAERRGRQSSRQDAWLICSRASGNVSGTHFLELSGGRVVACAHRPTSDGGWVATYEDVTERRQAEAKISHMARHDMLTGLAKPRAFPRAHRAGAEMDAPR